jgi:hypothetical protein
MSLWLPFLDHAMSYKAWTKELVQATGGDKCIYFSTIDRHQVAGFAYHGNIRFENISMPQHRCHWLLEKPNQNSNPSTYARSEWVLKQTMQRPGDRSDVVLLYKRNTIQEHD